MKEADVRKAAALPEGSHSEGAMREAREAMWPLLDEWKAGEPAPGFDASVLARIRAEDRPQGRLGGLVAWFRAMNAVRGFGLAGAVATVLFAALMLREPATAPETLPSQVAVQDLSAQQVELALEDLRMLDELYSAPVPEDNYNNKKI